jgi:hypothetical protein
MEIPKLNNNTTALHNASVVYPVMYDPASGVFRVVDFEDNSASYLGKDGKVTAVTLLDRTPVDQSPRDRGMSAEILEELQKMNQYLAEIVGDEL